MKKSLLFSTVLGYAAMSFAQLLPNGNFTTSTGSTLWTTSGGSVTIVSSLNVNTLQGQQSLRAVDNSNFALAANTTTVASLATQRYAFASRPVSLRFQLCYLPAATSEVMGVEVFLTKWNSGTKMRDTVAFNRFSIAPGGSIYPWSAVTCALTYKTSETPDSAYVRFITSVSASPRAQTAATLDDIKWSDFAAGLHDADNHFFGEPVLSPNPVAVGDVSELTYTLNQPSNVSIKVYDMTGRLVTTVFEGKEENGNHTHAMPTSLPKGQYTVQAQTGAYLKAQILIVR